MEKINDQRLRTRFSSRCYLCGNRGEYLYHGLTDRLFGVPGKWDIRRCISPQCGLVWLDPVPLEEDIGKAYSTYYTHSQNLSDSYSSPHSGINKFLRLYRSLRRILLEMTGVITRKHSRKVMWLQDKEPGRLLEVGCGSGERLAALKSLGWEVIGQEIDPEAIAYARKKYGVEVYAGPLEKAAFQSENFDVVIMNHVIEHAYDPISLLKECHRVLKPGGKLVVATPNVESLGHKRFGMYWRGLEPPRHLYVFSPTTLYQVARKAGYKQIKTKTISLSAGWIAKVAIELSCKKSSDIEILNKAIIRLKTSVFQVAANIVLLIRPYSGEEVVIFAIKD